MGEGTCLFFFTKTKYGKIEFVNNRDDVFTDLGNDKYQLPSGKIYTRDRTKYG